jgi:4'-phosphopantetheinyl transferase EntD
MTETSTVRLARAPRPAGPGMIESLTSVAVGAELYADVPACTMYPVEAALVREAVAERRREFGTVRYCARRALRRIGMPAAPLLPDADGATQWPAGVVGSMTHCPGYRAAAVARTSDLAGLGIDAEPHLPLPPATLDLVLRDEERVQHVILAAAFPWLRWDRLLFCAKEAVYKAWFPLTRRWLGFEDVAVSLHPDGRFRARLRVPPSVVSGLDLARMEGRWAVDHGLIVAMASLARPARPDDDGAVAGPSVVRP